jgi:hypothetical protein
VLSKSSFLALSCCGGGEGEWGETMGNVWNDTEFIRCHHLRNVHWGVIGNFIIWELLGTIHILPEREGGNGWSNHNKNRISTKVGGGGTKWSHRHHGFKIFKWHQKGTYNCYYPFSSCVGTSLNRLWLCKACQDATPTSIVDVQANLRILLAWGLY